MEKNIVLLHGWGAGTKKLLPLRCQLEAFGWNVYLPELPGFGKPAPKKAWGIKDYSKYINSEATVKFNNEEYFVFGHSFGGGIAIKLASGKQGKISGVILCATRGISRGKSVKRLVFNTAAKAGRVFLLTPKIGKKFKDLLYKAAREHDYEKLDGVMRDIFKKVVSEDLKPFLKKVNVPTLVLWGNEDKMTPVKDAYCIKKLVSWSKLVVYQKQGHRLPYEKPKELSEEIDKWFKSIR
jgi:pimeloyl-ACP methyl ester carboxylesterase